MTDVEQIVGEAAEDAPPPAATDAPVADERLVEQLTALPDHLQVLLQSLLDTTGGSGQSIDAEVVQRAFLFANSHHAGQKRKSGEDFIVHPVEVAKLVVELMLDTDSVIAALLHDVVEDTEISAAQVGEIFGDGRRAPGRGRHQALAHQLRAAASRRRSRPTAR